MLFGIKEQPKSGAIASSFPKPRAADCFLVAYENQVSGCYPSSQGAWSWLGYLNCG